MFWTSPSSPNVFIVSSTEFIIWKAMCIFPTVCGSFGVLMKNTGLPTLQQHHLNALLNEFQWIYYTGLHWLLLQLVPCFGGTTLWKRRCQRWRHRRACPGVHHGDLMLEVVGIFAHSFDDHGLTMILSLPHPEGGTGQDRPRNCSTSGRCDPDTYTTNCWPRSMRTSSPFFLLPPLVLPPTSLPLSIHLVASKSICGFARREIFGLRFLSLRI